MNLGVLEEPVFVVGMPRSGTTILFEALARHPDLGWLSNYCRMYPRAPWVNGLRWLLDNRVVHMHGHKRQYGSAPRYNIWLPQPDEAYEFWDVHSGVRFAAEALHGLECEQRAQRTVRQAAARVVRWQGRRRFGAKLTGPSRIQFLRSIFPDAHFVHVIRDGRAVVHSLLKVRFWREKGGLERPFWSGLLAPEAIQLWQSCDNDPAVLAGLQWKSVITQARLEAAALPAGRYTEVRYEALTAAPHELMRLLLHACALSDAPQVHEGIDAGPEFRNMNTKFLADFPDGSLERASSSMQPLLQQLGYV